MTAFVAVALACAVTVAVYAAARAIHRRLRSVFALPIVVTLAAIVALLVAAHIDVGDYESAARPVSFWLGPATVALAVPLHRERAHLRAHAVAIVCGVAVGAVVSIACALVLGAMLHLSPTLVASLAPKSVTTPIAMPIAERLGGVPSLTAAVVIVTGLVGFVVGPSLLDRIGVRAPIARGVAMGTAAHGIGTARAIEEGATQGAFAGVAIVVSGIVTAIVAPMLVR